MSSAETATSDNVQTSAPWGSQELDWGLIQRQIRGILRLELRRNLLGRRALALYLLAFVPVLLFLLWAISPAPRNFMQGPIEAVPMFAWVFDGMVRTSIFLSSLILFMSLFRSEILQRSLHYYLLTPVRREVLVVGKYLSALVAVCVVFAVSTFGLFLTTFIGWGFGPLSRFLFQGPGLGNLFTYIGIAVLGCVGYGGLFLLAGLFFRNPIVAGVVVWGWEFANFFLPPLLKKFSVIFYLQSLYPVPLPADVFAILSEPVPAWLSVPGLLLFTLFVLALAGWRARRMELGYGGD